MMKLYTVTVIWVCNDEPCEFHTKPFTNAKDAIDYFDKTFDEWMESKEEFYKYDDEEFDINEWYHANLYDSHAANNGKYIHLIYDEGEEKIFELKEFESQEF